MKIDKKTIKEYLIIIIASILLGVSLGSIIALVKYNTSENFERDINNTVYCMVLNDYYNKLNLNKYIKKTDKKTDIYIIKNFIKNNYKIFKNNCPEILEKTQKILKKEKN